MLDAIIGGVCGSVVATLLTFILTNHFSNRDKKWLFAETISDDIDSLKIKARLYWTNNHCKQRHKEVLWAKNALTKKINRVCPTFFDVPEHKKNFAMFSKSIINEEAVSRKDGEALAAGDNHLTLINDAAENLKDSIFGHFNVRVK